MGSSRNLRGEEDCVTSPKNVCIGGYQLQPLINFVGFVFLLFLISELETERRALEESEREKRLLASRVEDLSGRLELSERERREVMAELDAATKRLDQSEGGKSALVDQVM